MDRPERDEHRERDEGPVPTPSRPERRVNEFIERLASVLTTVVGACLIVFVAVALAGIVENTWTPLVQEHDFTTAALHGLDAAFLAIIIIELVHTTLTRGGALTEQVQQFLVIGITAEVRSGLEIAVNERQHETGRVVVNLALNAVGVLILVVSFVLVRRRLEAERQHHR